MSCQQEELSARQPVRKTTWQEENLRGSWQDRKRTHRKTTCQGYNLKERELGGLTEKPSCTWAWHSSAPACPLFYVLAVEALTESGVSSSNWCPQYWKLSLSSYFKSLPLSTRWAWFSFFFLYICPTLCLVMVIHLPLPPHFFQILYNSFLVLLCFLCYCTDWNC